MTATKICKVCNAVKPKIKFHGRLCSSCLWRRRQARDLAKRRTPEYRSKRARWNRKRQNTPAKKAREIRHAKRYALLYPEKAKAKQILRNAIRRGEIIRQYTCEQCGENDMGRDSRTLVHAHHPDYDLPLSVIWLCVTCHAAEHNTSRSLSTQQAETGET